MDCFKMAMLEVRGLELVVETLVLMRGLSVEGFYHFLSKRFLHDLPELLFHSKKYINAEEGIVAKKRRGSKHP